MPAPRMPRDPRDINVFSPTGNDPDIVRETAEAARAPDSPGMRPAQRHVLRPVAEYAEFEEENRLYIPRAHFPDGFDIQFVTDSVWGRPETQHRARFERQGWVPVHQEDFDGRYRGMFMSSSIEGEIKVDGLVLMARSKSWSDKAREMDRKRARERVYIKENQLRSGDLNGVTLASDHPTAVRSNIVQRSMDTIAMPVPER